MVIGVWAGIDDTNKPSASSVVETTTTRWVPQTSVTTTRTSTTTTTTTTTTVAWAEREYIKELLQLERQVVELIERVERINEEWDARTLGLSVTDQALVEAVETAQHLKTDFDQIHHPNVGIFVAHTKIGSAVSNLHAEIGEMLEGLRSPDAGETRQEALAAALETGTTIAAGIDRAAAVAGYTEAPDRNPTTTTTRPTTTTLNPDAGFRMVVAPYLEIVGMSFGEAKSVALGICAELDKGEPLGDFIELTVLTAIEDDWSDAQFEGVATVVDAGVRAFCSEHSSQLP